MKCSTALIVLTTTACYVTMVRTWAMDEPIMKNELRKAENLITPTRHSAIGFGLQHSEYKPQRRRRSRQAGSDGSAKGTQSKKEAPVHISLNESALLDQLNAKRGGLGAANMQCLSWNDDLAKLAQKWADECTIDNHDTDSATAGCYSGNEIGQTLFVAVSSEFPEEPSSAAIIASNLLDTANMDYKTNDCDDIHEDGCDNFRQAAWANSAEVGCAMSKCSTIEGEDEGGHVTICTFGMSQNYSMLPFIKGQACSCCPDWKNTCSKDGLCCGDKTACNSGVKDNAQDTDKCKIKPTTEQNDTVAICNSVDDAVSNDDFVRELNKARGQVGASNMRCLSWNNDLANIAKQWALTGSDLPQKNPKNFSCYDSIGMTTFVGLKSELNGSVPTIDDILATMVRQARYDYDNNSCSDADGEGCDNYRQAVWAPSTEVGCALVLCSSITAATEGGYIAICAYGHKPISVYNITRQNSSVQPFLSGDSCTCCPDWKAKCSSYGLCCGENTPCSGGNSDNDSQDCPDTTTAAATTTTLPLTTTEELVTVKVTTRRPPKRPMTRLTTKRQITRRPIVKINRRPQKPKAKQKKRIVTTPKPSSFRFKISVQNRLPKPVKPPSSGSTPVSRKRPGSNSRSATRWKVRSKPRPIQSRYRMMPPRNFLAPSRVIFIG